MKESLSQLISIAFLIISISTFSTSAQSAENLVPVHGILLTQNNGTPLPGLTISLIHPLLGRSAPSISDVYGRFGWAAIPVRPEPYYIEIYWGNNLVYRQPIMVGMPIALPPIRL